MSSQVGNTTNPPGGGLWYEVTSGKNQYAQSFTMPSPGGYITDASAYFDLVSGGPATCYVCVWDNSGALLGSASVGSVSNGTTGVDAQHWHSGTFAGNGIFVASGATFWLGIWTPGNCVWTTESTGACASDSQPSAPGSFASHGTEQGNGFPVYADYTPAGMYVNTGTSGSPVWTAAPVFVNTGTPASPVWTPAPVFVNTGTSASPVWTPTS